MNAHDPEAAAGELAEIPPVTSFEDFERETVALMTGPFKPHFGGKAVYDFMSGRPTRDWLLKGVFLAHTLFLAIGEPGCGKSYLMLDFVMTRALAVVDARAPREWFGRKFKPGGSVFIAAEGQEDFLIRIHAWLVAKGLPPDFKLPVWLVPTAIDMRSSDADAKTLIADIKNIDTYFRGEFGCGVDFVAVDTFNRALAGGDDTKPEHVGAFIRNSALIREQTGCTVGAVHHTPRGAERARGHSRSRRNRRARHIHGPPPLRSRRSRRSMGLYPRRKTQIVARHRNPPILDELKLRGYPSATVRTRRPILPAAFPKNRAAMKKPGELQKRAQNGAQKRAAAKAKKADYPGFNPNQAPQITFRSAAELTPYARNARQT